MTTAPMSGSYPARLDIEYPEALSRSSTLFRLFLLIPIAVLVTIVSGGIVFSTEAASLGITGSLAVAIVLMLLFRRRYPRWWFDFLLHLTRFTTRFGAYAALMTDQYPSTEDEQTVHLDLDYPDAGQLNRWLPLVKWILALPHYIVLFFLGIGAFFAIVIAWFAILFTGRYPRGLFDFVLGVTRWSLRVQAYAALMITDEYPPFSLK